jgi:hypothetical protein
MIEIMREPFLCQNASSQQFYLMMDWPSAACQLFPGDYAEYKILFASGMNSPGLTQIVEDIIRHKR